MKPTPVLVRVDALLRASRVDKAENLAFAVCAADSSQPDAKLALALVRLHQRRIAEAVTLLDAALALDPSSVEAFINRAALRPGAGYRAAAEADFVCALELEGLTELVARLTVGRLLDRNRPVEAIALARRALASERQSPEGAAILIEAIDRFGEHMEARIAGQAATARFPQSATLWAVLGSLHAADGRFGAAVNALRRARALDPGNGPAARNLAQVLVSHANTLRFDGRLDTAMATLNEAIAIDGRGVAARSLLMFCLLSRTATTLDELHAAARASGATHEVGIAPLAPATRPIDRQIRIGFLAPKLVQSSVKYFLRPVFDHHDPASAHLYLYDEGGEAAERGRLVRGLAAWRDIKGLDNAAVARRVRADEIDVLVDLSGHGWYGRRLGVFAHRPAPVQATCIGYPGTLGMASIGHRLTDRHLHPPGCDERFDEALVFLPHAFCYAAPDDAPAVASLPATTAGRITFASFNQLAKIDDATLRLWAAVLAAVPTARLLIKRANLGDSDVTGTLRARLAVHGIASDRITFFGPRDAHAGHLAAYGEVDVALDTFPYNGTTTTCEALWMGIPVVTRVGDREVSRTGLSLLAAAGLERWAAGDDAAYVRIAAELAADIPALARLRAELRDRLARSALCDGPAYARHFLAALQRARVDTPGAIC